MKSLWKRHGFFLLSMLAILIVVIASMSIGRAAGSNVTVAWVHPVSYIDGSTLDAADLKETVLVWRRPGGTTVVGTARIAAPATQTLVTGLACGSFSFTLATVVMSGVSSVETAPVVYTTGIVCAPNPPTNLKVT